VAWWSGRGYLLVTWGHVRFGDQLNFRLNLAAKSCPMLLLLLMMMMMMMMMTVYNCDVVLLKPAN